MKKRALVSVYDKTSVVDLCRSLVQLEYEILSTGGTASHLMDDGVPVTRVEDITKFPEILDGRVKTLHPGVHAGILCDRRNDAHVKQLAAHQINPIHLVIINLYPFEKAVRNSPEDIENAVENIDIGGPAMVRAAAKNFQSVAIVTDPGDYGPVLSEIEAHGDVTFSTRAGLAAKAFARTAEYDSCIAEYFNRRVVNSDGMSSRLPTTLQMKMGLQRVLRYGENPHQAAAVYSFIPQSEQQGILTGKQIAGKEMSFNNYMDLQAAWNAVRSFENPAAVIVKHQNPCGAAENRDLIQAYSAALECDPLSAYGGIVAVNRTVDIELAESLHDTRFLEVIAAPGFSPEAGKLLSRKKNRRIIEIGEVSQPGVSLDIRVMEDGALIQTVDDIVRLSREDLRVMTPSDCLDDVLDDLLFSWQISAFVKSNAIVLARDGGTVGIGAGQVSRVDAAMIAARKAGHRAPGSVAASDAFIPFRDVVDVLAEAGVRAIIQPGGSKGDDDVISACREHDIALVFTGIRHFRH